MSEEHCAYPVDDGTACEELAAPLSPYCTAHHALCHLKRGTRLEKSRLKQIEKLSTQRHGKWPAQWGPPPTHPANRWA
jgi:hypothetical protein